MTDAELAAIRERCERRAQLLTQIAPTTEWHSSYALLNEHLASQMPDVLAAHGAMAKERDEARADRENYAKIICCDRDELEKLRKRLAESEGMLRWLVDNYRIRWIAGFEFPASGVFTGDCPTAREVEMAKQIIKFTDEIGKDNHDA